MWSTGKVIRRAEERDEEGTSRLKRPSAEVATGPATMLPAASLTETLAPATRAAKTEPEIVPVSIAVDIRQLENANAASRRESAAGNASGV